MESVKKTILLGRGVLNWSKHERVSDRYGAVTLSEKSGGYFGAEEEAGINVPFVPLAAVPDMGWALGSLFAIVKETRTSAHVGDFFRGVFPVTPVVGENIPLGTGRIFWENTDYGALSVGVKPEDREYPWMDVEKLYRCHDQTVELYFTPAP